MSEHEGELLGCLERDLLPVVIHCQSEEGEEPRQSHVTIAGTYLSLTVLWAVFRIRIRIQIHVFFGLPDPDPLVRGMDPDPALDPDPDPSIIIMQK